MIDHPNPDMILASTPDRDELINMKRSWECQETKRFGVTAVSQIFFFNGQKMICIAQRDMIEKYTRAPRAVGSPREGPVLSGDMGALEFLALLKNWIWEGLGC